VFVHGFALFPVRQRPRKVCLYDNEFLVYVYVHPHFSSSVLGSVRTQRVLDVRLVKDLHGVNTNMVSATPSAKAKA
jgi:hypothetical protein